jgi:mannonate dehydratase
VALRFRVAVGQFRELTTADLAFASQIGASGITVNRPSFETPPWRALLGKHFADRPDQFAPASRWNFDDLVKLRTLVESYGLKLECIENTPLYFYDRIMLGLPGADEQLEHYKATIRALGRAGVAVLGYNWCPTRVWRTSAHGQARGGATATEFDHALAAEAPNWYERRFTPDDLWDSYAGFITAVLPVAEEAGVTLALHPDDPPVPELGGVARIMTSRAAFERALSIGDSPRHGLDFCVGTWAEMGVATMFDALQHFGRRGKLVYIHFRNVKGAVPKFREAFVDDGDVDELRVVRTLRDVGFDGFVIDDHVPHMTDDTIWGHRSRAFATGYIKGLCRAVAAEPAHA